MAIDIKPKSLEDQIQELSSHQVSLLTEALMQPPSQEGRIHLVQTMNQLGLTANEANVRVLNKLLKVTPVENNEARADSHQPTLLQQAMQRNYLNRIENQKKAALDARYQENPGSLTKKEYREYQHLQRLEKSRREIAERGPLSPEEQRRYDSLNKSHQQYWQATSREDAEEYNRLSAKINKSTRIMGGLALSPQETTAQKKVPQTYREIFSKGVKVVKSTVSDKSLWLGDIVDDRGKEILFNYQETPNSPIVKLTAKKMREIDPERYKKELGRYVQEHGRLFHTVKDVQEFFKNPAKRKEMLLGNIHIRDKNGQDIMVTLEEERDALTQAEKNKLNEWRNNKSGEWSAAELAELKKKEGKRIKAQWQVPLESIRYTNPELYRQKLREYIRESSPWYSWKKQFTDLQKNILDPEKRNMLMKGFFSGDIIVQGPNGPMFLRDLKKQHPRAYLKWLHLLKQQSLLFRIYRLVRRFKRRWTQHPELMSQDLKRFGTFLAFGTNPRPQGPITGENFGRQFSYMGNQLKEKYHPKQLMPLLPTAIRTRIERGAPKQQQVARSRSLPPPARITPQRRVPRGNIQKKNVFAFFIPFMLGAFILGLITLLFTLTLMGVGVNSPSFNSSPFNLGVGQYALTDPITFVSGNVKTLINAGVENTVINRIKNNASLIDVYKQASSITGIPWEILAGIHSREGGNNPDSSLVDGAPWKGPIPDISSCPASNKGKQGLPFPANGGCGFASLLDTAIWAGNLLKYKNGGSAPSTFQQMVSAVSRYNGGGNRNKPLNEAFYGDSDPYAMNFYDSNHAKMYVLYCSNGGLCQPPYQDGNPGVMTVAKDVYYYMESGR